MKRRDRFLNSTMNDFEKYQKDGLSKNKKNGPVFAILKIILIFVFVLLFVRLLNVQDINNFDKTILYGEYVDEYNNYYTITEKDFSINKGQRDLKTLEGTITSIIQFENGYKIFVDAKTYDINEGYMLYQKDVSLTFMLTSFEGQLEVPIKASLNNTNVNIIKVN